MRSKLSECMAHTRLTTAVRLRIYLQVLSRARVRGLSELAASLEAAIIHDREILRLERQGRGRRRAQRPQDRQGSKGLLLAREQSEEKLAAIIVQILTLFPGQSPKHRAARLELLAPIEAREERPSRKTRALRRSCDLYAQESAEESDYEAA